MTEDNGPTPDGTGHEETSDDMPTLSEDTTEDRGELLRQRKEPRVPLNTRILVSHDDALREFQAEHGATRQAVIDDMVREYLDRRGRLPRQSRNG